MIISFKFPQDDSPKHRSRLVSLGVSGDAPQMYSQLEEKLGSGTNIDGLQAVRVAHYCPYKVVHCCHRNPNIKNKDHLVTHYCPYKEDPGLRLAVARLAGLTKAFDDKYVQVLLQVSEDSKSNFNLTCRWSTCLPRRRP